MTAKFRNSAGAGTMTAKKQDDKNKKPYIQPTYYPPPPVLPGFPKAKRAPGKTGMGKGKVRARWIDPDSGDILEWDYKHGRIERHNDRGKHLGEFDPDTGKQTKPAKPDRPPITPTISTKQKEKSGMLEFYLTWFNKKGDERILGDVRLPGVGAEIVRKAFSLEPDDYPGDCLIVGPNHVDWLKGEAKVVNFLLDDFDYYVEVRRG